MTATISSPVVTDPYQRVVDNLDANFGTARTRRAAHAKGVVVTGRFTASPDAARISRAGHLAGGPVDVVARFSNFPGGPPRPDTAGEANPRGLAVQFRLRDGSTTDLLAHSIDGFPGRTVEDFADFLAAVGPDGNPGAYLADHPAAAAFVAAVQGHGTPASYATLAYWPVSAFRFHADDGTVTTGRYTWVPVAGERLLDADGSAAAGPDLLAGELAQRLAGGPVSFTLELQVAGPGDVSDDANAHWPADRPVVELGRLELTAMAEHGDVVEQGLFFDPVRLVDGITLSDDPLLVARTRTYPLSLARRHG